MKNLLCLSAFLCLWLVSLAQNTVLPFSVQWSLDTTLTLAIPKSDLNWRDWNATTDGDDLCFFRRRSFVWKEDGYYAAIYKVNRYTLVTDSVLIEYPKTSSSWKKEAQSCCIYSLSFEKNRLLLVCDHQILLFEKVNGQYNYVKRLYCLGVISAYYYQQKIYALVDDRSKGEFRWLCYDNDKGSQPKLLRVLPQPLPFLLQFDPNRYYFINESSLFYAPPGAKMIYRYSLDAVLLDSVSVDFDGWKDFPPEFVENERKLSYGVERISYALKHGYRQYSFAKTIEPMSDSLLFVTMNSGCETDMNGLFVLCLRKHNNAWSREFFSLKRADTSMVYENGIYPFVYYPEAKNLLLFPFDNVMFQLVSAPQKEEYEGRSVKQYAKEEDLYFKDYDPVVKLRVQKTKLPLSFLDYDNNEVKMSDLGRDKAILIVNRQPQCSGCQKVILKFLQSVDTSKVAVAMLFEPMDLYRLRRENDRQLLEIVPKYYKSLYMCQRFDYSTLLTFDSFPAVLFWHKEVGFVKAFSTVDIFTSDYTKYEFSDYFRVALDEFIQSGQ